MDGEKHEHKHVAIREIKIIDLTIYFFVPLVVLPSIWVIFALIICKYFSWPRYIFLAAFIIGSYFLLKMLIIGCVLMYKAFAPMEMRDRCRFVPTCSTYMIMAIKKYGIIRGLIKGIKRIRRCVPPNGGIDYP